MSDSCEKPEVKNAERSNQISNDEVETCNNNNPIDNQPDVSTHENIKENISKPPLQPIDNQNANTTPDVCPPDKNDNKSNVCDSLLPSMGILPGDETTENNTSITPTAATDAAMTTSTTTAGATAIATTTTTTATSSSAAHSSSPGSAAIDPSSVTHKVKKIKWQDIEVPIITQNNNGPCPLIAILNAMVLKGDVSLPGDGTQLTGGELVSVVGNALFDLPRTSNVPTEMRDHLEQNIQDAVAILHKLLTGLDVNIKFSGVKNFEFTSELCVFDLLGVSLYHGWVVEPASEAGQIISNMSYNQLTNNIISWHHDAVSKNNNDLLLKAMLCEEFMSSSVSQLTIHGLFELASTLADEEVAVLFRNNHFSTIYKRKGQVYQLLTDQGFLNVDAVWETLSDVDATFSEFVCADFKPIQCHQSSSASCSSMTKEQQINSEYVRFSLLGKWF